MLPWSSHNCLEGICRSPFIYQWGFSIVKTLFDYTLGREKLFVSSWDIQWDKIIQLAKGIANKPRGEMIEAWELWLRTMATLKHGQRSRWQGAGFRIVPLILHCTSLLPLEELELLELVSHLIIIPCHMILKIKLNLYQKSTWHVPCIGH